MVRILKHANSAPKPFHTSKLRASEPLSQYPKSLSPCSARKRLLTANIVGAFRKAGRCDGSELFTGLFATQISLVCYIQLSWALRRGEPEGTVRAKAGQSHSQTNRFPGKSREVHGKRDAPSCLNALRNSIAPSSPPVLPSPIRLAA